MNVLVIGGAGYIGSHMVKLLLESGNSVTVLDNFSTGHRDAILGGEVIEGDLGDQPILDRIFSSHRFDGVIHFASLIQVGESVEKPDRYYRNNVANTLNLLEAMHEHGAGNLIFSSSAAVFGEPECVPIDERHPKNPVNPYGTSKLMVERMLADFDHAYGLRSMSLRYFNAAGADPDGLLGERHDPETHLIPLVLQAASGRRRAVKVFGRDYDTPDGTCIRDYVHVVDLCEAHLLALAYLGDGGQTDAFNLGNGNGFSVQEVIDTAQRVTGRAIGVEDAPRRPGDPARLVADASRARQELGWAPRYTNLERIVEDAWRWESRQSRI
ncbi:MAG: UDP-glucose 4-epimerase GalE [Betaproteobacteria bacterium RIFCSPLOWO2_12_FULL_62_58]|nr:MAG: UDP-glucose 4-epimerase GalE [Betaproteobacteria bacterium RIFCSPLOWO2_12_FULL_62_58]